LAADLFQAGIHRVNVSLDTLNPAPYRHITGSNALEKVLHGLQAAEAAGMAPIKINTVVLRGINDDEITALARLTLTRPYHVRFIELMPTGGWNATTHYNHFMATEQIRQRVAQLGELTAQAPGKANGPARYFKLAGARGMIGFISPLSSHFCGTCNRLRLTADGHLRNCLFSETEIDIKSPLRRGASHDELADIIISAAQSKPPGHRCIQNHPDESPNGRIMRAIGG
jgi:cyclic pyranopterin phosphate synthase